MWLIATDELVTPSTTIECILTFQTVRVSANVVVVVVYFIID